jgi:hypothetical protein
VAPHHLLAAHVAVVSLGPVPDVASFAAFAVAQQAPRRTRADDREEEDAPREDKSLDGCHRWRRIVEAVVEGTTRVEAKWWPLVTQDC